MISQTKEEFLDEISKTFDMCARINHAKRALIKKRIELEAAPLYTLGFMDINKQYSTFGIVGLSESLQILGMNILEEEGQNFVLQLLELLNKRIDIANKRYKNPHNVEQVKKVLAINKI